MAVSAGRKRLLLTLLVASLVVLAGCGLGGDDTSGTDTDEESYPAVVDKTADSLSDETESAFLAALTDEEGAITPTGDRWVERLERAAAAGDAQRDAVGEIIATGELGDERLEMLDAVLDSPDETRDVILEHGLADSSEDGLLDGEATMLGLDPSTAHPSVAHATQSLRLGGYEESELTYLDLLANHTDKQFPTEQVRGFGLVADAVENGTVGDGDHAALRDGSGDGLLNGTAVAVGLDPAEPAPRVADLAKPLATDGYGPTERAYLERLVTVADNRSTWEQATTLGLLGSAVADGAVTNETVAALERREDRLLAGFAAQLELTNATANGTVASLAVNLSAGGYDETALDFLDRAAELTESTFQYEQARALSLLAEPAERGSVTATELERLQDSSGDGLLNPTSERLGLEPTTANTTVSELAAPLAAGGYTELDLEYLQRVGELTAYRGNEYERWAQADELNLLDEAVANGTVTGKQYWQLGNDASNRLLNGMEREFGTDPARADTSGDGYPDHLSWGPLRDLGLSVTPGEPDIYVEVDAVSGQSFPSESQEETIQQTFENEPSADIGPINVHFHHCDPERDGIDSVEEMNERVEEYRSVTGLGFHYLLVTDDVIQSGSSTALGVAYLSEQDPSWMAVDGTISQRATTEHETSTIAHELGHSLGILADDFDGVDSRELSATEYNSIMNYNHWTPVTFSTGEPFDDYEQMAERSFGSFHQSHDELDAMWEAGGVDNELAC